MREITEKHIIEMIKNNDKWKGAVRYASKWRGMQDGKRMVRTPHKGADK